jgi:hypothetical protein
MPTTYLLNAPVLTDYGQWTFSGPLEHSVAQALAREAISAVGHAATAQFIALRLKVPIATCRREVVLRPGDRALVFRLLRRRREGDLLNLARLRREPHAFALLERNA